MTPLIRKVQLLSDIKHKGSIMKISKVVLLLILVAGLAACASPATKLSRDAIDGNLAGVQKRVKEGSDVNGFDKWGWTPLHWAVYYRSLPVTKFLLENGANPNVRTTRSYGSVKSGSTPLVIAAYYGLPDFAELLLKRGAKTNVVDENGIMALDYAKQYRYEEVIQLIENSKH